VRDVHVGSVLEPLDDPNLVIPALEAVALAHAMGLIPEGESLERLDLARLRSIAAAAGRAGIGAAAAARLQTGALDREGLRDALASLVEALEASPLPRREWTSLSEVLGPEQLAALLGISGSSVRRYASGARPTPDEVAARLHFLAMVVADLLGTYNVLGVRRWFHRPRSALGGRSPSEVLSGPWDPDDEGPQAVRALARSLLGSSAT
jgi:hypothetical protein